jgi:hypothetical protein
MDGYAGGRLAGSQGAMSYVIAGTKNAADTRLYYDGKRSVEADPPRVLIAPSRHTILIVAEVHS